MARDPKRSAQLRRLAESLMGQVPDERLTSPRPDLCTSLVRQWMTYDGHATLIFGHEQHYLRPAIRPDGELRFDLHPVPIGPWLQQCMRDGDFGPDALVRAVRQLNIGQSAQIDNRHGQSLRLWVNPRTREKGWQRLDPMIGPPLPRSLLLDRAARNVVENIFGRQLGDVEKDDLGTAVARQWAAHEGHALILTPRTKLQLIWSTLPDGHEVRPRALRTRFPDKLLACGLEPQEIPAFLHAVNLGLEPELTDEFGRLCRVLTDPKTAQISLREVGPPAPGFSQIIVRP